MSAALPSEARLIEPARAGLFAAAVFRRIVTQAGTANLRADNPALIYMKQILIVSALLSAAVLAFGCGGGSGQNSSGESGEMPEGINTRPLETGTNSTPGIPANSGVNTVPGGPATTPGIPANSNAAKILPKGATPTPGIPDEETIRRQLKRTDIDANVVNQVPASNSNTKNANVRRDPLGRPRKSDSN